MNLFKSIIGNFWQDPNAAEVVKIPQGQLFVVRPGNIRTSRECIYNDAMAAIRRISNIEHHFQLVITRVYEEGDQDLLEDEDETDEEKTFLISHELEFRPGLTDDQPNFTWRDLQGDVDEFYEYVATGTNDATRAFFETCMYRAMYERKHKVSADGVGEKDLEEFIWTPPTESKIAQRKKVAAPGAGSSPLMDLPVAIEKDAVLFFWDKENETFAEYNAVTARILKGDVFNSWLTASEGEGTQLLAHRITSDMMQRWSTKMRSLTWNYFGEDGNMSSWVLRFNDVESYEQVRATYTQALWETLYQTAWGKMKPDEQTYVMSSTNEDVEMPDVSDDEEEEEEIESGLQPDNSESESEDEEEEEADEDEPAMPPGALNSQLVVAYKGDRSYVVRGNKIGYFTRNSDHSLKYGGTINNVATPKGKEFVPSQIMLHQQDSKMIMKNPNDPHAVYSMDLNRGKIVEEWKVHDDVTVDHVAPDNKFAPTTTEPTLVGASHNSLFRIDPRLSGTKMVESQFKQYVSKNKFSGVATTKDGKLAVASEKGDIRLFDTIGKNAKTALPPLGDPIIGIDVTADGRYIVATTKTYLLLIDTLIGEGKYTGSLGFDRSFPANAKPVPRRLQLRPEHVAFMNHEVSFSPARFNASETQAENAIVTSSGKFVIAWDFNKVKKNQLDKYEIKRYEDFVIQDTFRFDDDKEIVVALANDVVNMHKKQLRAPTRVSLGAPRRASRSHSEIVNAPY
ncbi:hypothetical protein MKEN_00091500 [Mycena kentingensis (nom. inval.)]|nr:hypothetical protein MKEN_00091500 [Mycena kentingensis (nom. inval.)]